MRTRTTAGLILILLLAVINVHAQTFPPIEQYTLSNGLKVILIDYGKLDNAAVSLYVNCGSKNETPGQQAYSQLTSNSILLGNKNYDRNDFEDAQFKMGTSINANSNENYTTINASFTNADIDSGLKVFSSAVLYPTFPKDEIDQYISQMMDYNNPSKLDISDQASVFSNFWVYGSANPVGRYFYKDQLMKVTPAALKEFYEFNFTPKNARLVICGKTDKEKVKTLIEKYFGEWKATYGEVNGVSFESPVIKKKEYAFINRSGASQCALQFNKTGPDTKSKDVIPFELANNIFSDVLFKEIREKGGKTYGIGSDYNYYSGSSIFTIGTRVRSNEAMNTIKLFDQTLSIFYTNGVSAQQLKTAKKNLKNRWSMIDNPSQMISFFNPIIYPKPEVLKTFMTDIDNIALEDINKLIKKYYSAVSYKLMIAGDQSALKTQLDQLGSLKIFTGKDLEVDQ